MRPEYARKYHSALSVENIKEFAGAVDIAYEGMSGNYGLGIGRVIRRAAFTPLQTSPEK